ncbi:MAG: aldo/keto reductase [Sedimentisphaerales bacterium]|nr:aldo/keto reductase [Sedimentisphaerales bacterium]
MGKNLPTRRDFIKQTAYGLCAGNMLSHALAASGRADIPTRPLGSTGVNVSILGLGGHHIGRIRDDNQSIQLIRKAIDSGVTFLDNAWEYHNGRSEELMGKALAGGYRNKAFLMTKHHGRNKKTAMEHLEDSLRRLRTDVIDLWQFHEVVYDKDPEMIFAAGGGIEAAELAKKQGKVRFIGFTGHRDPVIHLKMLAYGYPWDAVQMPMNVLDPHFKSFQKNVLPILVRRNIGVIAMKTLASGYVLRAKAATPKQALDYIWSQQVSTIVSGMDSEQLLKANVGFAQAFRPMGQMEQAELLDKTKDKALTGKFEPFKTPPNFDGPIGRKLHGIS